jgi:hypothetical protein
MYLYIVYTEVVTQTIINKITFQNHSLSLHTHFYQKKMKEINFCRFICRLTIEQKPQ